MNDNMPTDETMSEGSAMPPMAAKPDMKSQVGASITVPVTALATPGEDEMMNNPGEGDMVSFHVEGKVASVQGENAVVTIETVNGKPVSKEAAFTNDTPEQDDEFEQLKTMAAQQGRM
jgi:hypothetical protein